MTKTLWQTEAEFIHLIANMRRTGIKIDREFCKPRIQKGNQICQELRNELGWNPGSSKQIGEFLIGEMNYPVVKRSAKTGAPSFDKFALEEYELMLEADGSNLAQKLLRYRGWQKTVSSNYQAYLNLADKDEILHPNYKVHGARTCRTSCEKPNLQQIPKETAKEWNGEVKKAFVSREELLAYWYKYQGIPYPDLTKTVLVNFDFSQLETRLAAATAREESLLEAFRNGIDVFEVMANELGWPRDDCKTFNYATLYGAGAKRIAMLFKVDIKTAQGMINSFFKPYPNLKKKIKQAEAIAKQQKYIRYWTGRRRHFDDPQDYHKAFNAAIQGGAFEIVKRAGLRLQSQIKWPLVLTVHDSYVVELPVANFTEDNCMMIKHILEAVPEADEMGVNFKVDYGIWGES